MNYCDEHWIKVYTRDTAGWLAMSWQARGLALEIARRLPKKTGELSLGRRGLEAVALLLRAPYEEIKPFIDELIAEGKLGYDEEKQVLFDPQHVDRQSAVTTPAERKRRQRETHPESRAVTRSHGESRPVTKRREEKEEKRESDHARARGELRDEGDDGVDERAPPDPAQTTVSIHRDSPLTEEAREVFATVTMNKPIRSAVEAVWTAFCGQNAGSVYPSSERLLGRWQKWVCDQPRFERKSGGEQTPVGGQSARSRRDLSGYKP